MTTTLYYQLTMPLCTPKLNKQQWKQPKAWTKVTDVTLDA